MTSDGEESETTLIPFYGFLPNDHATYLNYMRFSMSPQNEQYTPQTRSINWGNQVPSTAPGYNKGLCAGVDRDSLFGEHGYYTEIRRITDADGSVWWWPLNLKREAARVEAGKIDDDKKPTGKATIEPHRTPGKAGWFAGVHSVLFRTRFAGIDYDAPTRVLTWQPLSALGDFEWQNLPFGREQFSIKLALTGKNPSATVSNPNAQPVTVRLRLPGQSGTKLSISGQSLPTTPAPSFGESSVTGEFQVSSGGTVTVSLKNGE